MKQKIWTRSYSKKVNGLTVQDIWDIWTDIDHWNEWQDDVASSKMLSEFKTGGTFLFQPKGGPKLTLELTEVVPQIRFTDVTRFPFAKMYDAHEIFVHGDEIELKCTTSIEGPLAFFWRKAVAEGVVKGLPSQIDALIARIRQRARERENTSASLP